MNEDKRAGASGEAARAQKETSSDQQRNNAASRARNRTVMLTPEMTGQVRALLYQEPEEEVPAKRDPLTELLPPMDWSRPDTGPAASAAPHAEEDAYGRDFSGDDEPREGRSGSTGKLDASVVHEAAAAPVAPEPRKAATPQISVNPQARPAAAAPRRAPDPRRAAAPAPTSRIVGFFVSFDKNQHGETFEIRAGRWLITSRPTDHGEFILIEDETISPLHAIVRATKEGKIQVLDQLSEFGTGVTRQGEEQETEVSGTMVNVEHGDVLRLGERRFVVCAIPPVKVASKPVEEE